MVCSLQSWSLFPPPPLIGVEPRPPPPPEANDWLLEILRRRGELEPLPLICQLESTTASVAVDVCSVQQLLITSAWLLQLLSCGVLVAPISLVKSAYSLAGDNKGGNSVRHLWAEIDRCKWREVNGVSPPSACAVGRSRFGGDRVDMIDRRRIPEDRQQWRAWSFAAGSRSRAAPFK